MGRRRMVNLPNSTINIIFLLNFKLFYLQQVKVIFFVKQLDKL